MNTQTVEDERPPAPGRLGLVQEFLNATDVEPSADVLRIAEEIRRRHHDGESEAALAREYGFPHRFVRSVLRGKRLVGRAGSTSGGFYAEGLGTAVAAQEWLVTRGLLAPDTAVSEDDRKRLLELRGVLRALARGNNGQPLDGTALKALDRISAGLSIVLRFDRPGGPALEPRARGCNAAMGEIVAAVFEAMRDGTWQRLKECPAHQCYWVFYDSSRNHTGTWCAMSVCGNRAKVRSYQQRRGRRTVTPSVRG